MKKEIIQELKDKIEKYLDQQRLADALALLRTISEGSLDWETSDRVEKLQEQYRLLLGYATSGATDPDRPRMLAELRGKILDLVDILLRQARSHDEPTLYFNTLRYRQLQRGETLDALLQEYSRLSSPTDPDFMSVLQQRSSADSNGPVRQDVERRIFNYLWTTHPLSSADQTLLHGPLTQTHPTDVFPQMAVGALLLGGLEYYDRRRLELLADIYASSSQPKTQVAALIALLILLHRWRHRGLDSSILRRLASLRDTTTWRDDLPLAIIELARTRDTDRISRKIRDEIVPEMLRMRPELERRMGGKIPSDISDLEENPEWQEMLADSGIADKLRQMSEIQEEGGDVMIASFSHLKTFPFFAEVSNWFVPFTATRMEVADKELAPILEMLETLPILCDNDKYSMAFAYRQIPPEQRQALVGQIQAQAQQMAQIQAAALNADADNRKNLINKHVQGLYRFFTLFRRKNEFHNPFAKGVNLVTLDSLQPDIDHDLLQLVAEFYFARAYWPEALEVMEKIESTFQPTAELYQKMGYARQKLGDTAGALALYEHAQTLADAGPWLLRRLAWCYMRLGKYPKAIECYDLLEKTDASNASIALSRGNCLLMLERIDQARTAFYKADYLKPDQPRTLRALAWCLLLGADIQGAQKIYERLAGADTLNAADYLNMGHLAWARAAYREAMNLYALSLNARSKTGSPTPDREAIESLRSDFLADAQALEHLGLDTSLIPLILDQLTL